MSYTVLRRLGAGAYGEVFEVERGGRRLALKRTVADDEGPNRSVLTEAYLLASLRHPHLLAAEELVVDAGNLLIFLPLAQQDLLHWRLRSRSATEKVRILFEVACGLQFLHSAGVIHGDLKAENILLFDGQSRIADFGLAQRLSEAELPTGVQTVTYRAPEILDLELAGSATAYYGTEIDMWSFGVLAYLLINDFLPFNTTDPTTLLQLQLTFPFEFPAGELGELLNGCLQTDPGRRLTATEVIQLPLFRGLVPPEGSWVDSGPSARVPRELELELYQILGMLCDRFYLSNGAFFLSIDLFERSLARLLPLSMIIRALACFLLAVRLNEPLILKYEQLSEYVTPEALKQEVWEVCILLEFQLYPENIGLVCTDAMTLAHRYYTGGLSAEDSAAYEVRDWRKLCPLEQQD